MPKLHDFRADFRKGRTGPGLRIRQDTRAYIASLKDANNCMILADYRIRRRWGTFLRKALSGDARVEGWDFASGDTEKFILLFEADTLTIYDLTFAQRAQFTGQGWTSETMRFMAVSPEASNLVITDQSFQTVTISFNSGAGTFSLSPFAFTISEDGTRLRAPFYQFADSDMTAELTIYTSAGHSTGYSSYIATARGIPAGDFDLAAGTGKMSVSKDFFVADHVGTRMRLLDGEVEILSVVDAQNATVKVWSDVAKRLDVNPLYLRKNSKLVEVAYFDHGLKVGDLVFLAGIADADGVPSLLRGAIKYATSSTTAPAPVGTAAAYAIKRVVDKDHFEIEDPNGTVPTNDVLTGGADVVIFPFSPILSVLEPVFSDVRGWPQAGVIHDNRLWLGSTPALSNAVWGSEIGAFSSFDPGDGSAADAVQLYGVGDRGKVRHLMSAFDLIILTDKDELYVPGSTESATYQETARAVPATKNGAAYTAPQKFDGGVFFAGVHGFHIHEMDIQDREQEYSSPPVSIISPDWVKGPHDSAVYGGGVLAVTPYLFFVNNDDGAVLVLHSAKLDDAFGFMRWTLDGGNFRSIAAVGTRLFAVAERGGSYALLEFDTTRDNYTTVDFATSVSNATPQTSWSATDQANRTLQAHTGARQYQDITVAADGSFTTPEAVTEITIGEPMSWLAELHAPVAASGQGPKAGKKQRLVDAEIHWDETTTGEVEGQPALDAIEAPAMETPTAIDGWRKYLIGKLGTEPTLKIQGSTPGAAGLRGVTLNVYF